MQQSFTGKDFRIMRVIKGLTQRAVATKAGMHPEKLSALEHSKRRVREEKARRIQTAIQELSDKQGGEHRHKG